MGRIALAIVALTALTFVGRASATTVAIVRSEGPSPLVAETVVRLEGELRSVGFETAIVEVQRERGGHTAATALGRIASRWRVDAAVGVFDDVAPGRVETWVVDRSNGRTLDRSATLEAGLQDSSRTLAIRALELLRSSLLELDLSFPVPPPRASAAPPASAAAPPASAAPPAPPPATSATPATPAVPAGILRVRDASPGSTDVGPRGRVGFEVGGVVVASTGGVGAAFAPLVRIDWAPKPEWVATLSAVGLGTRPTVRSKEGSAEVSRSSALLAVTRRFRTEDSRVRPLVSLGAGALRTTADGSADAPNQGRRVTRWSLLLEAALGAELRLDDHFFLRGAAHVQLAEPYLAVRLVDEDMATLGRPDLLLTLSAGAWL